MGKRLITGLILAGLTAGHAYGSDEPVCDDADHCVWIMENHGPHEFDYEILTRELQGFGAEGKNFLIMLVGDKDADIAGRAIDILYEGQFRFNNEEARKIVAEWPGSNMDKMANLMVKVGTPDVQGRMIESLLHEDRKVRDIARDVLARLRENKKIYALKPHEHGPLAKAVVEQPTRELVQMLAAFTPDKTRPFLQRALATSDGPSVIAAYDGLHAMDKEMAFQSLLVTLRDLKPEQAKSAFAIGALLRHRDKSRGDDFYMEFAKELAEDESMSLTGRMAGLDAILGGTVAVPGKPRALLESTPAVRSAFEAALQTGGDNIFPYESNFKDVFGDSAGNWAPLIWSHIQANQQSDSRVYDNFFSKLESFENSAVQNITLQALAQSENIKTLKVALASAQAQNDQVYRTSVDRLTRHWADDIRYDAIMTLKVLNGEFEEKEKAAVYTKALHSIGQTDRRRWKSCKVSGAALTDYVVQLPYFTLEEEVSGSFVKRRFIEASYPTPDGWFVGFAGSAKGALWYFENESGLGDPVVKNEISEVSAIMPIRMPGPGKYATDFWVVSADTGSETDGRLNRATQNSLGVSSSFHRYLPRPDFQVSILPAGRYLLTHKTHSPLILSENGSIRSACE